MKVALVYDRVNKWGGAERVLLALHRLFPDAPLFTSVYNKKDARWADVFSVKTSFLQKIPLASGNHEFLAPLMPLAFESFDFGEYDLVISVTSEAAKGIITKPQTRHICYMLTPTRYLWSGYDDYFENNILKIFANPIVSSLRKWDLVASSRPDMIISISKEVQKRVKKYYERDSELVYPPAGLENSKFDLACRQAEIRNSKQIQNIKHKNPKNDYFLVVSRLSKFTRYKRVDLAIDACTELGLPLKIIGEGSLRKYLEKSAGPTVEFLGNVDDDILMEYYRNCRALIFPGFEDLGLTMIEAQRFGKPVIAFEKGGSLELIVNNKTGIFFENQTKESLILALQKFEKSKFDSKAIIKNAERFNFDNFKKEFLSVVNNLV